MGTNAEVISGFRFALDLAVKATLLFALTGVLLLLLRRRSAAARHVVGVLGLASGLLVPFLSAVMPRVAVPVLPLPPAVSVSAGDFASPAAPSSDAARLDALAFRRSTNISEEPLPAARKAMASETMARQPLASPPVFDPAPRPRVPGVSGMAAVLALWIAGTVILLARLVVGMARVRRYRQTAERVVDPEWTSLAARLGGTLGVSRAVQMYFVHGLPVAVTTGLRRPVLLLPEAARGWDESRRRVVLLHELAHIARRDWPALLVSEIAMAVYWFHPLAWILGRRLRRDGERAADDRVLTCGTKPSVYAGHLLGIIRSLQPESVRRSLPAMGMARPSHFEERLRAILDPAIRRRRVRASQTRLAAVAVVACASGVAALQPWAPASGGTAALDTPVVTAAACSNSKVSPVATASARERATMRSSAAPGRGVSAGGSKTAASGIASGIRDTVADDVAEATPENSSVLQLASNAQALSGHQEFRDATELHEEGKYIEAAGAFARAYEQGYRRGVAAYNAACAWARAGRNDQAFEWLEKASSEGFRSTAHVGDDDDLEGLRRDPRLGDRLVSLGRIELEAARKSPEADSAARRFEDLAKTAPERGDEFYKSGMALLRTGRYDLAERAFRLSARRGYRTGASLYNAACALARKGDRAAALDLLQQALEAGFDDPKLVRTDDDLAAIHSEPRFRELADMAEALELRADSRTFWNFREGRDRAAWKRAAARYEEFATSHRALGRAWFNLGYARLAAGDAAGARQAFERSVALEYRKPTSLYNLACAYSRLGQKDQAFDALFKAVEAGFDQVGMIADDDDLGPLHGDARFRKALRLAEQGKPAAK